jgi:hypothetical protein
LLLLLLLRLLPAAYPPSKHHILFPNLLKDQSQVVAFSADGPFFIRPYSSSSSTTTTTTTTTSSSRTSIGTCSCSTGKWRMGWD